MTASVGSTPQGTAPTQAPPPAPNLTQAEVEDRVAAAFMDSLDESTQEAPAPSPGSKSGTSETAEDEAPEADEVSTDAEAEPDADEAEAEADEADAEDDESEDEQAEAKPKKQPGDDVTVKLDDGTQVTLRELKRGFLRQSDYTRKTQELSETRKAAQAEREALSTVAEQQKQAFEVAAALIRDQIPDPPDPSLIKTNPQQYLALKEARESAQRKLHDLAVAYVQSQEGVKAQSEAKKKAAEEAERKELADLKRTEYQALVKAMPKLATEEGRKAFMAEAAEVGGRVYGITPEQIGNIISHVEVRILHDAIQWRKLQSQKMEAVSKAKQAPPLRPANRVAPGTKAKAKQAEALSVLRNAGSTEDARMAAAMKVLPDDLFG
jgi:hypothetical protein